MAQLWYRAVMERGSEAYWVFFPDFDGCTAAGDTAAEAARNATEVLAMFVEDWQGELPDPSPLDAPIDPEAEPIAMLLLPLEVAEERQLAHA